MQVRVDIKSYILEINREGSGSFGSAGSITWVARIRCEGSTRDGATQIHLYFVDDLKNAPANARGEVSSGLFRLSVFLDHAQYAWVVDLLRNEAPVMLLWEESDPNSSFLSTSTELPGEGE